MQWKSSQVKSDTNLRNVIRGYFGRQHQLKAGKVANFQQSFAELARLFEKDICWIWVLLTVYHLKQLLTRLNKHKPNFHLKITATKQTTSHLLKILKIDNSEKQYEKFFDIYSSNAFDSSVNEEKFPCTGQ